MTDLIAKLYRQPILGRVFHTLVYCLQRELRDCETVLDIGCGPSSPVQYCQNIKYSLGVEPFLPYLQETKKRKIHTEYTQKQAQELAFPKKSFDAVIMIEVLEHLPKKPGLELLRKAEGWARKKVVISTPNGYFPMNEVDQNPWQEHQSGWTVKELIQLGFKCQGLAGLKFFWQAKNTIESMGGEGKDGLYANVRFRPKKVFYVFNAFCQVISYYFPQVSFELFAVKRLK
ncbi:class I SAM-dependent methyltransferase [Patescibacteria group bacterium]